MTDPLTVLAPPRVVVAASAAAAAASSAFEPACHAVESIGEPQKYSGSTAHERYAVEQYDQRNCPICLEGYTPENPAVVYGCGHAYHLQCAEGWRLQSGEDACCMCGANIHGNAAAAEPIVLNSAATPGRSPAKSASPEAGGAGSSSSSPPPAAAAIAGSTRAILPSTQSLDGLAHMSHTQTVCSHAHPHVAAVAAADAALSQSQRRHRRSARSSGASHDSPDGGAEDEAAPLTPGVEPSPHRPRGNRGRRGTGGRIAATFSASSSPSPTFGVRVARRGGGPSPDRIADSPTADPLLADDAFGAWATMRRLICCCFPGGGDRRAEHVVQAASVGAADEGSRRRRAEPSRQRAHATSYFTHSGSPRQRRATNAGSMPDDDDDDGFVMVPTPSQSDAEDESVAVTTTEVRPPRRHRLARGWPE